MFVVSPHLDDAALGIGHQMAQAVGTCVTVFAGRPARYSRLMHRPHDERCGFRRDEDVMAVRREEDETAFVYHLGSWKVRHLHWLDTQYVSQTGEPRTHVERTRISHDIVRAWEGAGEPSEVWVAAGYAHPDHILVRDLCVEAFRKERDVRLAVWAEPGYRSHYGNGAESDYLGSQVDAVYGHLLTPAEAWDKLQLVDCYRSQLNGISALALSDALTEETWGVWT